MLISEEARAHTTTHHTVVALTQYQAPLWDPHSACHSLCCRRGPCGCSPPRTVYASRTSWCSDGLVLPATLPSVHLCKRKGAVQIYCLSVTEPVKIDGPSIASPIKAVSLYAEGIKDVTLLAACHLQNVNGKGSSKLASSQKPEPLRMCHNTLTPARTPRSR